MNTTVMILIAVIALTQVFGFVIIRTLSKRVRNIDLSEKIGISNATYVKKCNKM